MFANFELWSGGLVDHADKPRQARSVQGCEHCRRAKKKCDERKPVCGRCRRRGRPECVWRPSRPASRRSTSVSPSPKAQQLAPYVGPSASLSASPSPPPTSGTVVPMSGLTDELSITRVKVPVPPSVQLSAGSMLMLPESAEIPADCISTIVRLGNDVVHGVYFDDRYTLLVHSIPLFAKSPPLLYVWLSISAMQAAQRQSCPNSPWLRTALHFHSKAISGLAEHLHTSEITADWALLSIMLLHLYEKLGDDHQPPSFAHIATARHLFLKRFINPPDTIDQVLQLDCLIYRLAVFSTFHTSVHAHFDCVNELVRLSTSSHVSSRGLWRHSLWVSVPLAMFDTVFKLSFLLRQRPLSMEDTSRLDQLEVDLTGHHQMPDLTTTEQDDRLTLLQGQASAAHSLYTYACLLIVAKLRNADASVSSASVQKVSGPGFKALDQLSESNFLSPVLLWPASILGLAAQTEADRLVVTSYINRLASKCGLRAARSVLRLLGHAWEPSYGDTGLGVLFNDRLLSDVFL